MSSRVALRQEDRASLIERLRTREPEIELAVFALLDRLTASIADEYERELEGGERSPERRRAERVERLLDGVPVDVGGLGYELDGWHVGVIATGANATQAVRGMAAALGRELLRVMHGAEVWAWLGGERKPKMSDVERVLSAQELVGVSLAIGEAATGVQGWRVTHREAQAALLVAQHRNGIPGNGSPPNGIPPAQTLTRYLDVALEAAPRRDLYGLGPGSAHQWRRSPGGGSRGAACNRRDALRGPDRGPADRPARGAGCH